MPAQSRGLVGIVRLGAVNVGAALTQLYGTAPVIQFVTVGAFALRTLPRKRPLARGLLVFPLTCIASPVEEKSEPPPVNPQAFCPIKLRVTWANPITVPLLITKSSPVSICPVTRDIEPTVTLISARIRPVISERSFIKMFFLE